MTRDLLGLALLALAVSAGVALVVSSWWSPAPPATWPDACAEACLPGRVRRYRALDGLCECEP